MLVLVLLALAVPVVGVAPRKVGYLDMEGRGGRAGGGEAGAGTGAIVTAAAGANTGSGAEAAVGT